MDQNFATRRRRDLIIAAVLAALAALAPLFIKDVYVQNILILTLMYAALSRAGTSCPAIADRSRWGTRSISASAPIPPSCCSPSSAYCPGSACSPAA
ncbi:hypothetical protein ACVME8_001096 [Bradyrhizobium diazoefficiens]